VSFRRVHLDETSSTNDEAMARGRAGAPTGLVVTADAQSRGRGRQGRAWQSPAGQNLYLSLLLRPDRPPAAIPPITLAAAVGVADALNQLGVATSIKWPNDVLVHGRKIAGILTETSTRGDRLEHVVIGIGINVNQTDFPPDLAGIATSLCRELGREVDREAVLAGVLDGVGRATDAFLAGGVAAIASAWRARSSTLGTRISVVQDGRSVSGVAIDLDEQGALRVRQDDGGELRVLSGEIMTDEGASHER
jgi:BirA family biotin operon repressor/biotin-[acetyl-CoA-carboxylase] ligase